MKKLILTLTISLLTTVTFSNPNSPSVTNAKVLELTAHRIERLTTLGKIDSTFLNNLEKMEVTIVLNEAPVYYKVRASQTQPAQGAPMQLDVSFDADGKPLSFQVLAGGATGPAAGWADIDATTLTENALHYILENNADSKVAVFDKTATSVTLSKGQMNGATVARALVTAAGTTAHLNIYLKLDGTFVTAEVIP